MVDDIKKTITTDLIVNSEKAIAEAKRYREQVDAIKQELLSLKGATKQSLDDVATAFKQVNIKPLQDQVKGLKAELSSLQQFKAGVIAGGGGSPEILSQLDVEIASVSEKLRGATTASTATSQALRELKKETGEANKEFSALGNVAQRVFRSIIGFVVLNILRQLLGVYDELITKGKEFARSIVDVSIAVRTLQRAGYDITQLELEKYIQTLRNEFKLFSETEIRQGVSSLLLLGEQLNLTKEQLYGIAEASAIAATRTGTDYKTAIDRVTRALATGQTRGLVELGFAITETTIKQEAYRSGLAKVGDEITDAVRVQAIYNLLLEQSGKLSGDVSSLEETLVGQVQAEEKSIETLKASIGNQLLPAKVAWLNLVNRLLQGINGLIGLIKVGAIPALSAMSALFVVGVQAIDAWWKSLKGEGQAYSFQEFIQELANVTNEFIQLQNQQFLQNTFPGLSDLPSDLRNAATEIDSAGDEIDDSLKNLFINIRENIINADEDIAKENRKFLDDLFDDYLQLAFDLRQLAEKLAFDRAKIERDSQDKIRDINKKARDKEIDAEKKFQDRMRQLRARFLFDLEEALQERDARQILRLIREFNLRKSELERQRDEERRDIEDERRKELQDLHDQREQRLRELDIEYAFRRQKLLEEFEFERQEAEREHERKLREIRIQTQQRNQELLRRYQDEHELTASQLKQIGDLLNSYFGPNGYVDGIYAYYLQSTANTFAQIRALMTFGSLPTPEIPEPEPGLPKSIPNTKKKAGALSYADGGTLIAKKPTLAIFGDGGPERVDFLPLTRPTSNNGKAPGSAISAEGQSRVQIEVLLSKDLEARWSNKLKNDIADVVVKMVRQ